MLATTIEQSQHLLEFGLSSDTADMVILHEEPYETSDSKFDGLHKILSIPFKECDKHWKQKYKNISYFPAWSLGVLLEVLKNYTDCNKLDIFSNRASKWSVTISYYDHIWKEYEEVDLNLMNAVVNTALFLLENGYIKNEK